mmetsp:Transcript_61808/g.111181  ORF Transcript_61808/g.111181 Transcript_61808/m.111181 type:complete len:755 (+) Transcript_61808:407-2671(+)
MRLTGTTDRGSSLSPQPSAGVAHAGRDAVDGKQQRVLERHVVGARDRPCRLSSAQPGQSLHLDDVEHVDVVHARPQRALQVRVVVGGRGVPRDGQNRPLRHFEALPQVLSQPKQRLVRDEPLVVMLGDGSVGLGHQHLDEVDRRVEPRPLLVHLAQLLLAHGPFLAQRALEGSADAEPRRQVQPRLSPGEDPGDRTEGIHAALRVPLRGPAPHIQSPKLELRGGHAEVRHEERLLPHHRAVEGAGPFGHGRHSGTPLGSGHRALQELVAENRRREDVHGALCNVDVSEVLRDHLALLRHAELAVDGPLRMREDRLVDLRVAAAAHGATLAVEERDLESALVRHLEHLLLRLVLRPHRGDAPSVLGRVRVAHHHLLLASGALGVPGRVEELPERGRSAVQVVKRLEQRRDLQGLDRTGLRHEQLHRQDVGRRGRLRDDVRAERAWRQLGRQGGGLQHLQVIRLDAELAEALEDAAAQQGPARAQLLGEPRHLVGFAPGQVAVLAGLLSQRVHGARVPRGLLPEIERRELHAEGPDAPQDVDERAIGKLLVAAGDEGRVHLLQRGTQLLDGEQRLGGLRRGPALRRRDHQRERSGVAAGAERLQLGICPRHGGPQAMDQLHHHRPVRLHGLCATRQGSHRGRALPHAELDAQSVQLAQVQQGCLAPLRGHHLARGGRRDVGVAVAVAAHPRGEDDGRRVQRKVLLTLRHEDRIQAAHVARDRVPERGLQHREPLPCLLRRRWLGPPQHVRAVHGPH